MIIAGMGLLATAPVAYRWRRSKTMAALISGGWLAMTAGLLIGPAGFALIAPATLLETFPLLETGMGWIGLMVGLQLRREVLRALPQTVRRMVSLDTLVSVAVFGGASIGLLSWWWRDRPGAPIREGTIVLIAAAAGWAMETRSLRREGGGPAEERLAVMIRAGGSLATVIAIGVFAFGVVVPNTPIAVGNTVLPALLVAPLACVVLAVFMGIAGRFMLSLAGKQAEHQLAVFLGIVAFVAGIATELEIPALFAAMMTGAVMANLKGVDLRRFERFILAAEHALAVIFAVVAGVLLDPVIGWAGVVVALGLVMARHVVKPAAVRFALKPQRATTAEAARGELPMRSRLYSGAARQSPIAMVMLVGLVLAHPTEASQELLTVVAITGLLCELVTMVRKGPAQRTAAVEAEPPSESATPVEPEGAA